MIIIDSDNYAASGIETLFFPGGEPHAKIPKFSEPVLLHLKLRTWNDTGIAACVMSALMCQETCFNVFVPYFPGARQDKSDGTAPLTIELMSDMFVYADNVYVFDPHSSVLQEHVSHVAFMPADLGLPPRPDLAAVIAPDHGALQRATQFRNAYAPKALVLGCSKTRDPYTGRLSNYQIPPLPCEGRYLVVDDTCDGGATFNLLANAWSSDPHAGNSTLELFVSHGIFSGGLGAISDRYTSITTTDSWCGWGRLLLKRLTVLPLLPALLPKMEF